MPSGPLFRPSVTSPLLIVAGVGFQRSVLGVQSGEEIFCEFLLNTER